MKLKKYIAVFLCAVIFCGSFLGTAAAAVTMPAGVSEDRVVNALPKLESLVGAVLRMNEETADLSKAVYRLLISDDTLNGVFSTVYSAFSDQAATLNTLGVDISVQRVSECLAAYPDVQAALAGKESWDQVFSGAFAPKWNVSTKGGFGSALASMFWPLNDLLYTLLCGGTYTPNLLISVRGADGYQNVIVPILRTIGAPNVMTQEEYTADAKADRSRMLMDVAEMLFAAVDNILATPVLSLCDYLPAIADYLVNGGLKASVTTLLEPLRVRVGIFSLSGVDQMLERLGGFSDAGDLTAMLENMDTSSLFGSDVQIDLPEVDLQTLSECGSVQGDRFVSNAAEAFVTVFRWAVQALKMNASRLPAMLGQDLAGAQDFINKLLAKSADELLVMILDLLELKPAETVLQYRWNYPAYTPGAIEYTANLTRDDYTRVLQGIDSTLNDFLSEFTDNGTLSGLLAARIYSNSLVSQLVTGLYGALYTEETAGALAMMGLDASPKGLANSIASSYPGAASILRGAANWKQVNPNRISWGFSNGSRDGFVRALTAVLAPFRPFLSLLLAEGNLKLLDTVTVSGSNGYDTAVIPLLEALGCNTDQIKTYAQYKASAGSMSAVTDILTPVTGVLDQLVEAPVATLCRILPNLVYFMNAGGLKQCVENLIYPVRVLLQKIGAEALLGDALTDLTNIDLQKTMGDMIVNAGLNIKLPEPDLNLLASLGTAETRVSRRTYNGAPENYVYIVADEPAVLLTVLRYVVGALGSEENAETLSGLFQQDNTEEGDMMAMYTGKVAEQLKTMSTDETIEWLYNLLFAETPKRQAAEDENAEIPHIIYQETEKHTTRNVGLIVGVGVVVLIVLMLVLSRVDFTARRERKKHLKLKKQRIRAQQKAAIQNGNAPLSVKQYAVMQQGQMQAQQQAGKQNAAQEKAQKKAQILAAKQYAAQQEAQRKAERLAQKQAQKQAKKQGETPAQQDPAQPIAPSQPAQPEIRQPEPPQKPQQPKQGVSMAMPVPDAAPQKFGMSEKERIRHERELARMRIREEKARQKAYRETKKADKYYEQALKEQQKKKH